MTLRAVLASIYMTGFAISAAPAPLPHPPTQYIEGDVIVTFKDSIRRDATDKALANHSLGWQKHFDFLSGQRGKHSGLVRSKGRTTASLIAELSKDPAIETAEPNYRRWISSGQPPNDPLFPQLWAMRNTGQSIQGIVGGSGHDIKFLNAWSLSRPATNQVVIAVIDTGIDYTHPDLVSNLWINPGEIRGNGVDDDHNGYVDDYYGYDFADETSDPLDSGLHGTHVSGTIAAVGNNSIGVIGVDYQARIMALKASSDGSSFADSDIIQALQYATMMKGRGVNIVAINASWGGGGSNSTERAAIQSAGNAGIIFCAAAGNSSLNHDVTPDYPSSYRLSNMIVIAASDQNDTLASFSDYGANTVDLGAPGVSILSTIPAFQAGATGLVQRASSIYIADGFSFAGTTPGIIAPIIDCGLGYPSNFTSAVRSNIALISRGTLFFSDKVANAMGAGARAAIIYNNVSGSYSGTLQFPSNWIPAVAISQADGQSLLSSLPGIGTVVSLFDPTQIYEFLDGTSMATPHVSGAVGFAAMNFPTETVAQRVQRILSNVDVVSGLQGKVRTNGRLNLQRIVDSDANGLPDWWEQTYFAHLTGTDPNADPDNDGLTTLQEYIADTNPANPASALRVTSTQVVSNRIRINWSGGVQARQYLQRSSSLNPATWTTLFTNQPPTSTTNSYFDASATNVANYYRIGAERP